MEWHNGSWWFTTIGAWSSECFWDHVFMVYVWVASWWSGEWMRVRCLVVRSMLNADDGLVIWCGGEWMRPASRFIAQRECPSCLSSEGAFEAKSLIMPSCCGLDSWTENNCPGYSRVTVYSLCAVLHRARSYPSGYGYSFVWSSTLEWLMLQTSNQGSWHAVCIVTVCIVLSLPRLNCW